jgi:hypothetical protein
MKGLDEVGTASGHVMRRLPVSSAHRQTLWSRIELGFTPSLSAPERPVKVIEGTSCPLP